MVTHRMARHGNNTSLLSTTACTVTSTVHRLCSSSLQPSLWGRQVDNSNKTPDDKPKADWLTVSKLVAG
jgi:hypothetical protein